MDESRWWRRKYPWQAQSKNRFRSRRHRQDERRFHTGRRNPIWLRLVLDRGEGRQAGDYQNAERREPAGARWLSDPGLRCMGALILHRLPESPTRLPEGFRRSPGKLGLRGRTVRRGEQVGRRKSSPNISFFLVF